MRRFTFRLSLPEQALHAQFVLPAALRHFAGGVGSAAAAAVVGSASAPEAADGAAGGAADDAADDAADAAADATADATADGKRRSPADVTNYGAEKQLLLIDHVQRSLLAPQNWASWGLRSKRQAEMLSAAPAPSAASSKRRPSAAAAVAPQSKAMPSELVGLLVDDRLKTAGEANIAPGSVLCRRGHAVPLHKPLGASSQPSAPPLWPALLSAARYDVERASLGLRELVETHAFALGEVQVADLEILQTLVALTVIGHCGHCGAAADAPSHMAPTEAADVERRRTLTNRAIDVVLRHLTLCADDAHDGAQHSAFTSWARDTNSSDGVRSIFTRFLRLFDPDEQNEAAPAAAVAAADATGASDDAHGGRLTYCGALAPLNERTRWAHVAPFLAFRMTKQTLSEEELKK